jgi:two-component system sensor histidine kinase PilS (NtrC family)
LAENPQLSAQDQRLTKIIQTHSVRINHIIDDILQLSRRTASRREKIVLQAWLESYLNSFIIEQGLDADAFKLHMTTEPLCSFIDPGHLKQILDNLCQNALKYGNPQGAPILLRLLLSQLTPCIEVIDNGPGIKTEHLNHLFEPFFTTSTSGTGLGLYISKELAELNQANLSYHLSPENQSCFRLCLMNAEHTLIEI